MVLPNKWSNEVTAEVSAEKWARRLEYLANAAAWKAEADKLTAELRQEAIDAGATALVADGRKVATYRPIDKYAEASLRREHPEVTQHFMREKTVDVFDIELFVKVHPEIAEPYRVRAFKEVETAT